MDRRYLLLLVGVIAILGIVNATVFAYRWIYGTIEIAPADQATGAACTGFYSSVDQENITDYLPRGGTNFNAPTYGNNRINITPGDVACTWTRDRTTYKLYESIEVTIPVTVGSWYIQDFYAFGYKGATGDPTVYVYFVVEDAVTEVPGTYVLYILKGSDVVGKLDLTQLDNMTGPIGLEPGEGVWFSLRMDASAAGTATFKVGVYVSHEDEQPRPIGP